MFSSIGDIIVVVDVHVHWLVDMEVYISFL